MGWFASWNPCEFLLAGGDRPGYQRVMKSIRCLGVLVGLVWIGPTAASAQQASAVALAPGGAQGQGQARGIRAVTRRTLMSGYGADSQAMFTAAGMAGFQGAATLPGGAPAAAPIAPTPSVAMNPALQRRDVQTALRRFAAAGDSQAAAALAESRTPASAEAR
jgi:hypothetical protein